MSRFVFYLCLVLLLYSCASQRTPVTPGVIPQQRNTISAEDQRYGSDVLKQLKRQYPIDRTPALNDRVEKIVLRLTDAIDANLNPWQVFVLRGDDVINAAATRGNYVFVWTGMLKTASDDGELASVLAHEIGHVIAGHVMPTPGEQANKAITGVAGVVTKEVIVSQGGGALGTIGGQIVQQLLEGAISNPESQRVELEADHIGLFVMAKAGYNPEKSVSFWKRLHNSPGFQTQGALEFLSTHPSSEKRIKELEALLPRARAVYQGKADPGFQKKSAKNTKPEPNLWRVMEEEVLVYEKPDTSSKVLGVLDKGRELPVSRAKQKRWLKIELPKGGFVQSFLLSPGT